MHSSLKFTVSDIYYRDTTPEVSFLLLDMTDLNALKRALHGFDTVLIANAMSPLYPNELIKMVEVIAESDVKSVVVYSAEDLRLVNGVFGTLKTVLNRVINKKSMWIGYLYNSAYVSSIFRKYSFERTCFEISRERGPLSSIWGSSYLAKFSRDTNETVNDNIEIDAENLLM